MSVRLDDLPDDPEGRLKAYQQARLREDERGYLETLMDKRRIGLDLAAHEEAAIEHSV